MTTERPCKTTEDSKTEITHLLQYKDINGSNRLFGGRLMEWIDETAAMTAMRHCGGQVITAAIDNLQFKSGAYLNDLVVLIGKVTYVGNTSMEVRVDTYVEDKQTGDRRLINHAYLVVVYVDQNSSPIPIEFGLARSNDAEEMEWEGAKRRLEIRKQRRLEGF